MHSDERLTIETPEQIALELPIAGIGSRFLAVAVDTVLQAALSLAAVLAMSGASRAGFGFIRAVAPAFVILFTFCVYWGYFALFEILWSGRTPGKRAAGIRVIKDSGRSVNAYEAIGRNVVRAIDFLPLLYAVGVVVMMCNRQSRRIGDYVAGTVVVQDRPGTIAQSAAAIGVGAMLNPAVAKVTAEELQLIETYLERRLELDPLVSDDVAERIARRIADRIGVTPLGGQSPTEFLEALAQGVRDAGRFR